MKKGKDRKVAAIHVTPETKSKEEMSELESILESYYNDPRDATPKALLCVSFLMDWYTNGINDELPGIVSSGLSRIIRRCAYGAAERYAEYEELLEENSDLEKKIQSSSRSGQAAS